MPQNIVFQWPHPADPRQHRIQKCIMLCWVITLFLITFSIAACVIAAPMQNTTHISIGNNMFAAPAPAPATPTSDSSSASGEVGAIFTPESTLAALMFLAQGCTVAYFYSSRHNDPAQKTSWTALLLESLAHT
jgi:hypothetical protein